MSLVYRFDDFELDPLQFEIRRSGSTIHAQPKVLRLLFHLVANRDRSVSTRELLENLWPGEAVTVASVKRAIAGARRALGELGDSESSIRTVRGHGYRFVREVQADGSAPLGTSDHPQPATKSPAPHVTEAPRSMAAAVLDRVLAEASTHGSQTVLIHGAPGTGKSSTLRELNRRASDAGALVLWTRCTNQNGIPPLWPVVQMLRLAADEVDPARLGEFMDTLSVAVPNGHYAVRRFERHSGAKPSEVDDSQRFAVSHAFASLLQHSAEQRRVVVAFDDLQYADPATLQLLAASVAQLEHSRVTVVATLRSLLERESVDLPSLRAIEARLSQHRIDLEAMTEHELATFSARRLGRSLSDAETEVLRDWTGGNPRLCDHLLGSGIVARSDLEECAGRADIGALLERQLSALPAATRELLRTAAISGRVFSLASLARTVERPAADVLSQLRDALTFGLVQPSGAPHEYRFTQALIREGLYLHTPHAERARLHARVASALDVQREADDPTLLAQIADHWLRAAPSADEGRAFEAALRAARAAMTRDNYEAAAAYFERALQVAALAELGDRERLALLLENSHALVCLGHVERASESARAAADLALEHGDTDGIVQAARLLGRLPIPNGNDTQRPLLEAALAALPEGDARRPSIEALLARAQIWSRDPKLRASRASSALAAARRVVNLAERGEALRSCLHALADPEFFAERLAIAEELEVIGRERADRELLTASACARVWTYCEVGDMPGIDASIQTLELLAVQGDDPFARWYAKVFRAMRGILSGRLGEAARCSHEALALGEKLGRANAYHVHCTQLSGILRLEGQLERAAEVVREVSLRHPAIAGWQAALASLEAELGRSEHAREVLKRLLDRDLAALLGDPYGLGALAPAADLCAQVGDAEQAQRIYDLLVPYSNRHGVISMGTNTHGPLARHLGRLAMRSGDAARAEWHLKRAIEEAERCESPTFTSLGCLSYAQMLMAADRRAARERATVLTDRAYRIAIEYELHGVADRARQLAQRAKLPLSEPATRAVARVR